VHDLAIARFNARVSDVADVPRVQALFDELIATANGSDGIQATLHGSFASPPKPLDDGSKKLLTTIADCGKSLGMNITWRSSGGSCDGNRLAAAGLPVVDTLGPVGDFLHSPREYVVPSSIAERAKLVAILLMRLTQEVR
jgi:glutamate carboxypeptidase